MIWKRAEPYPHRYNLKFDRSCELGAYHTDNFVQVQKKVGNHNVCQIETSRLTNLAMSPPTGCCAAPPTDASSTTPVTPTT